MGNNATKMSEEAMRATKKAQLAVGSGLQSMNRCISKETGEREDAAMFRPHPQRFPLPPQGMCFLWDTAERCAALSEPAPPPPPTL